jgi:hypothetical protein
LHSTGHREDGRQRINRWGRYKMILWRATRDVRGVR